MIQPSINVVLVLLDHGARDGLAISSRLASCRACRK